MAEEDDGVDVEGRSFWDVDGYRKTTKRITQANQLCDDLMEMAIERGEIEAKIASMLRSWASKWQNKIEKGPEYGSMQSGWKQALRAAEDQATVHIRVRDKLSESVVGEVKKWQKDNFHKGMMSLHLKEKKEMDEEFKRVQKPWAKLLRAVQKTKDDYHTVCQKEQTAENTARNAANNPAVSEDQKTKLRDELARLGSQKLAAKGAYEDALSDLNKYNPKYMEDMRGVYQQCQEKELKRLEFFKSRLIAMHHALDLTDDATLRQINMTYLTGLERTSPQEDLKLWDQQRGMDMKMNWPIFEEYSTPMTDLSVKQGPLGFPKLLRKSGDLDSVSQTGTIKRRGSMEESPRGTTTGSIRSQGLTISAPIPQQNGGSPANGRSMASSRDSLNRHSNSRESVLTSNPFESEDEEQEKNVKSPLEASVKSVRTEEFAVTPNESPSLKTSSDHNPFNEEWAESPTHDGDSTKKSVMTVKALFDYSAEDSDELSFKEGDVFEKLEDKDEQGWCKGRKDGKVGLFPDGYVEAV